MSEILASILVGIIQGITEWLPISSEGIITILYLMIFQEKTIENALGFAIWVHGGTAISVTVYFRNELSSLFKEFIKDPLHPSPLTAFLITSTLTSIIVVSAVIFILKDISESISSIAMLIIGLLMLFTGIMQTNRFRRSLGIRNANTINTKDAILSGIGQGFAILPGISRSATTVSIFIFRGFEKKEALRLSFLMSVPASWGAAVLGLFSLESGLSISAILALIVSAIVGFFAIKLILHIAEIINFSIIVFSIGSLIILGSVLQLLFSG
tara:strand:+ start:738 stop:1547 length:810 start_codon:yes stop_codon:yes gene_type:complete